MNKLYYGDNLTVMREQIAAASVDLVYLDPPFNSKQGFSLLFKTPKGHASDAQIAAFKDSWQWGEQSEFEFAEILHQSNTDVAGMIESFRRFLHESDMMAYLTMMTNRLLEIHRILKPTGCVYLHCDPTASHYLKIVLDHVFGDQCFSNEIIWRRTTTKNDYRQGAVNWPRVHDVILMYYRDRKSKPVFEQAFEGYSESRLKNSYRYVDENGRRYCLDNLAAPGKGLRGHPRYEFMGVTRYWRYNKEKMEQLLAEGRIIQTAPGIVPRYKRYLDEMPGVAIGDVWNDIPPVQGQAREYLGYPTQKPVVLLERIICASSKAGDVVLDPFCGCGTAIHAAHKLERQWMGIDITHLAISLIEKRLRDAFPGIVYEVHGTPKDIEGARDLAARDKYQFQWWACSLVNAQPYQGKKKGADTGIDGLIYFQDDTTGNARKIIVSVKGGANVTRAMVADLKNTVEREKAQLGFLVTLTPPTQPMLTEAASAGLYESPHSGAFPRIQILTIEGLLSGAEAPRYPDLSRGGATFKKAQVEKPSGDQPPLLAE